MYSRIIRDVISDRGRILSGDGACCGWALFLVCLCSLVAGCHTATYHATNLPPFLQAESPLGREDFDLSRLSGPPARNDVIRPGDQILVSIATGLENVKPVVWAIHVSRVGFVDVPIVGPVQVAGRTFHDAEQVIRVASIERGHYVAPTISVALEKRRTNLVTVLGEVNKPGTHELPATGSDLLAALAAAEGLTGDADTVIDVWHPVNEGAPGELESSWQQGAQQASYQAATEGSVRSDYRHIDLASAGEGQAEHVVWDGTVVKVRARPPRTVQVIGLVKKPDQFEIPVDEEMRLLDAIAKAGGRTLQIADKVRVIRRVPESDESVTIASSVREAKRGGDANLRLAAGDVVSVEQTPATFVVDTLKSFIRFGFSSGVPGF